MSVELNHTIVWASDSVAASRFLADLLGRPAPVRFGPFEVVALDNGASLDFAISDRPIQPKHIAFLISEAVIASEVYPANAWRKGSRSSSRTVAQRHARQALGRLVSNRYPKPSNGRLQAGSVHSSSCQALISG